MKQSPGSKCVNELLTIPGLIANKTYRLPFTGILRCVGTAIVIPTERIISISEMYGKARVEVVVDAQDELRHELEKVQDGKLIQEEEMVEKIKLSILVSPDDPWVLKLGKDADNKFVFVNDLNA